MAEKCSFKAAAEELGRTQPSITLSVQQLEETVGLKLLERTTRKVIPTAEGERFIPIAKRLVRDFDSALSDLVATSEGRSGHVTIAVNPSVAAKILPPIIKIFSERYSGISVHVSDGNSRQIQNRILRNEADFGIGRRVGGRQELEYEQILEDRIELVCHKSHPLGQSDTGLKWQDLEGHELLDSGLSDMMPDRTLAKSSKYEFSTTATLFAMIKADIGVAILPSLAAGVDDQMVVARPISGPTVKRDICIVRRKQWTSSPPARLLLELLHEELPSVVASLDLKNVKLRADKTKRKA